MKNFLSLCYTRNGSKLWMLNFAASFKYKTHLNCFVLSVLLCTASIELRAQSSASANASATITIPISIEKVPGRDLDFGNIAAGNSVGMVILNPTGVRHVVGGATLSSTEGTVNVAEFLVKGEDSYSFSITLPAAVTLLNSNNNSQTMTVDSFTSTPETTGTLSGGETTLKIGARLTVNANQDPGSYVSDSPFSITVNYN